VTAPLAFRIATYLLALDGLAALHVAGLVGSAGAALVGVAIVASWWRDHLGARLPPMPRLGQAVIVVAAAGSALDLLYVAESLLDGFVRLLLFLLLYRLFTRRSLRDARDVGFLSFFMLVGASAVTFDIAFLFVFLVFLVLGVWMFMLHHVLTEAERVAAAGAVARARLGPGLLGLSLAASAATLAITTAFFFIIPRVGQAALPFRARLGTMVSGFSEHVELGAFGQIETDASVVMRVRFPEGPPEPNRLRNLRWRGIAFDQFDGHGWKAGRPELLALPRPAGGQFEVSRYRGIGPFVAQEIYLEPIGTEIIFAAPRVLRVTLSAESLKLDDMGSVSVPLSTARLRYVAYSELEPMPPRRIPEAAATARLAPALIARYTQLPPLDPRVAELAREVSAGSRGAYEAAARLTSFLSREYRYTLLLSRQTPLGPVEDFLFARRSGNCEYFGTALAVMLRSLGIPARLVNGFQRGEWNPYGRYFMIRQRDAHTWVEAFIDGVGWVTFDPSPRGDAEGASGAGSIGLYLDALRLRWYRYVVNWSLRDQVSVATAFQRGTSQWRQRLLDAQSWKDLPGSARVAGGLVLAGLAAFTLWRRRGRRTPETAPRIPRFYERALRALARRGLRPEPGETAREFLARVAAGAPAVAAPLSRLTAGYELARFGAAALSSAEAAELEGCVAALEHRRSS
jgi:transglutaminase-like putative cysteine protease